MTDYLERVNEIEKHFCERVRQCVKDAKDAQALKALLLAHVWGDNEYKKLPKKAQNYINGYAQGAADVTGIAQEDLNQERLWGAEAPPKEVLILQPGVLWRKHVNGGGWVSETAFVESSALVAARACVFGNAKVYDRVRIYGSARVAGDAECYGVPHIHGRAFVGGSAKVFDAAKVLGDAHLGGNVLVGGTSVIRGAVKLTSGSHIDKHMTDAEPSRRSSVNLEAQE
jgi:cytoskeletal protein CcmA (bactofilin family)